MEHVYAVVNIVQEAKGLNTFQTFGGLVTVVVTNAFVLAGIISFVFLVIGGLGVVRGAGGGDPKKLEDAKKTITGATLGLVLVVMSYFIVQVIEVLTGVKLLSPVIK